MRARRGYEIFDYGDFTLRRTAVKGWLTYDSSTSIRNELLRACADNFPPQRSILARPVRETRAKSTYAFVQEILSLAAERGRQWKSIPVGSSLTSPVSAPSAVAIRSEMVPAPDSVPVIAEIMERTGDSTRTQPGVPKGRRRTGRFVTVKMPVYERFKPTLTVRPPAGYIIPAADTQVVRVIRQHGIIVDPVASAYQAGVEVFQVDSAVASARPFQGHRETRLTNRGDGTGDRSGRGVFRPRRSAPRPARGVSTGAPER